MNPSTRRPGLPAALIAASLLALAPGCAAPTRAADNASPGAAPDQADQAPKRPETRLGYALAWKGFPVVRSRQGTEFFELMEDTLVVHDHDNVVTVMDANSGRNLWSSPVGAPIKRFVGNERAEGHLVVSSHTDVLLFDVTTGELKDRQPLNFVANTRPVIWNSLAIYGGSNGEILAHNLAVGYKAWGYAFHGTIAARPCLLAGTDLAVVSQGGDVAIIDVAEATARGRREKIFDGLANNPVGDNLAVYVASKDQSVYAFARQNGKRLWRFRTESPITAQPALHAGTLYVNIPRMGLTAINARTGEKIWANPDARGDVVAMRNNRLIAWDGQTFTTLDPARGETLETIPFPDVQHIAFESFEDGALYTISRKGIVQKFIPAF